MNGIQRNILILDLKVLRKNDGGIRKVDLNYRQFIDNDWGSTQTVDKNCPFSFSKPEHVVKSIKNMEGLCEATGFQAERTLEETLEPMKGCTVGAEFSNEDYIIAFCEAEDGPEIPED